MPRGAIRAVLLDLDGVLLRQATYPPQTTALYEAVEKVHDVEGIWDLEVDRLGKTDLQVARELVERSGGTFEPEAFGEAYVAAFHRHCPWSLVKERRPGAYSLLVTLHERHGIAARVASGNVTAVGRLKLKRAGYDLYVDSYRSGWGIYEEREKIVYTAACQEPALYICDTARDIAAGHAAGVECWGLVTGEQSENDLVAADLVLWSLPEVAWELAARL